MQFQNIIGQKNTKEHLVEMVQHNRLSHALLFLGKEGSGALSLAMAFAQYIVCEKAPPPPKGGISNTSIIENLFEAVESSEAPPLEGLGEARGWAADSCGTCSACTKSQQLIHPDIHFSYPVITKKSGEKPISTEFIKEWREFISIQPYANVFDWLQFIGAENKQGNITAEECNDINRKISLKSFESEYKILIIWMPEYLTKNGNKLLKLIEEPPAKTLFILVAENEEQILPTIISRTQLVKIPSLTNMEVEAALELRAGAKIEIAQQIAALSEGNYREALQLLQHSENDWQATVREWLNLVFKRNMDGQVKWIEAISKEGREKQKQFLQYFIHLVEDSIRLRVIDKAGTPSPYNDFCGRFNKMCSIAQQEAIADELNKAAYYIERNCNPKMLFHALSIKLYHIITNNSLILVN